MRRAGLALAAGLLAGALAGAQPEERPGPVKWAVAAAPKEVKAGQVFRVTVLANVAEGWHLYSMQRKEGGPVPTTITLPGAQWFRLAGAVEPPVGVTSYDEGFGMEVETYLGEAEFILPLETPRSAPAGEWKLKIAARYQACDNRECLPPKTVEMEVPVRIVP